MKRGLKSFLFLGVFLILCLSLVSASILSNLFVSTGKVIAQNSICEAENCVLYEGEQLSVEGKTIQIAFIDATGVKFNINGQITNKIAEASPYSFDNLMLSVNNLEYSSNLAEISRVYFSFAVATGTQVCDINSDIWNHGCPENSVCKEGICVAGSPKVFSISLTGEGNIIRWTVDGYSSQGFKVVWSKNENPTYPLREGDQYLYLTNPSDSKAELKAFSGSGLYYVRVCEYLGGKCGVYSNQIELKLGSSECTDSDGGKEYYVKGIIVPADINSPSQTDTCMNSTLLTEYYCNNHLGTGVTYQCPNGCVDGACVKEAGTPILCEDSDGGVNYYVKGEATDYLYKNEVLSGKMVYADSCLTLNENNEGSFESEEGNYLSEKYCIEGGKSSVSKYKCPNGCKDGACIKGEGDKCSSDEDCTNEGTTGNCEEGYCVYEFEEVPCDQNSDIWNNGCPENSVCNKDTGKCVSGKNPEDECSEGCSINGKCVDVCYIYKDRYCSLSGEMVSQQEDGTHCYNHCECSSGVCVNNECISGSLIQKILNWFKHMF